MQLYCIRKMKGIIRERNNKLNFAKDKFSIPKKPDSFTDIEKKSRGILTANSFPLVTFEHLRGIAI